MEIIERTMIMAVPRDKAKMAEESLWAGCSTRPSKAAGMTSESTDSANMAAEVCADVTLNFCSENLMPPARKHRPSTKSRLDRMEPSRDAWTTRTSPAISHLHLIQLAFS